MPSRLHVALFALSLAACAGRDGGPAPITPTAPPGPVIADATPGSARETPPPIVTSPDTTDPLAAVDPPQTPPETPPETPPQTPPTVTPETPPTRTGPATVTAAVASVRFVGDCPDTPEERVRTRFAPPPEDAAAGKAISQKSRSPGGNWTPPCEQSTVQLSLSNNTTRESSVRVTGMRLLNAKTSRSLGRVAGRKPTRWDDNLGTYQAWNGRVQPGTTANVAYRIGEAERSAGAPPGGDEGLYILEVDVTIDGKRKTLRSPEFTREMQHIMVT